MAPTSAALMWSQIMGSRRALRETSSIAGRPAFNRLTLPQCASSGWDLSDIARLPKECPPHGRHQTHARARRATGVLVLADGSVIWGRGFGAEGEAVGEVCFNTAMTGYQEIMTDPSYAAQIVTFTFPHIGNVGANYEDLEADNPWALGCVVRQDVTAPSNFRAARASPTG